MLSYVRFLRNASFQFLFTASDLPVEDHEVVKFLGWALVNSCHMLSEVFLSSNENFQIRAYFLDQLYFTYEECFLGRFSSPLRKYTDVRNTPQVHETHQDMAASQQPSELDRIRGSSSLPPHKLIPFFCY